MHRPDPYWLQGRRVVVTAGGTREPIDPVRYIGNRSSGRMGNALAIAAARAGGAVTLITAAQPAPELEGIHVVAVETAAEMLDAVLQQAQGAALLVMAAAVADYRPARVSPQKIPKQDAPLTLELERTVDILSAVDASPAHRDLFVVGFAAETQDVETRAAGKLAAKGLDMIVVNDVSRRDIGMDSEYNEVTVLDATGVVDRIPRGPKAEIAEAIIRDVRGRMS